MFIHATILALGIGLLSLTDASWSEGIPRAAPEIIIFVGGELTRPVVMTDWDDNHQFLLAAVIAPTKMLGDVENRRSLRVAMFWGMQWRTVARDPAALARLSPDQATQQARLYPAQNGSPAMLVFPKHDPRLRVRRLEAAGLNVLARYGVPVR